MANFNNKIITELTNLGKDILKHYRVLEKLECSYKTESEEFKQEMSFLQRDLYLEDSLYEKLGNDPNMLAMILDDITFAAVAWDLDVDFILLLENKDCDLIDRRIILRLCDKINESKIENPLMPLVVGTPDINSESYRYVNLNKTVREDFINTILVLLNEQIFKEKNESIRSRLIQLKYNIGFFYKFVEIDFLNHNYAVNPELIWTSPFIASLNHLGESMISVYQIHYATSVIDRRVIIYLK